MITAEITKHQSPNWSSPSRFNHGPQIPYYERWKMDKFTYAQYISGLSIKRGDLVISKWIINNRNPASIYSGSVHCLTDIIEIHHHVDSWHDTKDSGPLCLILTDINGKTNSWRGGGSMYVKCPEELLPDEWKTWRLHNDDELDYSC